MTTPQVTQYDGFAAFEKQPLSGGYDVKPYKYAPKKFAEDDLEVEIEASGVSSPFEVILMCTD